MEDSLDRSTPIPLYFQLKSILLRDIQNGVYAVGSQIPTEKELMERFQLSRSTVRQALNELVTEGWLERKTSKGSFVSRPKDSKTTYRSFDPFYKNINKLGKTPRTEVMELKIIEASESLANDMGLLPGEKVITMFRRRYIDEEPVLTVRNYLPLSICSFILQHDFKIESLYEILMSYPQTRVKKTRSIVSAEKAKVDDVNLLNIKRDCPILVVKNISTTLNKEIVDYAFFHYRGDLNDFEIELDSE